jgi:hypothetical protein
MESRRTCRRGRALGVRGAYFALYLCLASCSTKPQGPAPNPEVIARPPLQRLTHDQYDNTIRDLLGIGGHPSVAFAEDEEQAGYAANTTLPVQELQLVQYEQAAESLAAQAVGTPGTYASLVPCAPVQASGEASCVDQFLRGFGKRAFRRPLADDEVAAYASLFESARAGADFASGVRTVLAAMLQSPNFLYRLEWGIPGATPESDGAIPLSQYEIATRMSYFLWDTTPDDSLLAAADAGQLGTVDAVSSTARRMTLDPRARDGLASFHVQWLQLQGLPTLEKTDPTFTADLRSAMSDEVVAFVDGVLRQGDGRLDTLLTADFSYLEGSLYDVYGVAPPAGGSPSTPTLAPLPSNRAGVLTLPAVLAVHAHADQTSIVHRGLLVQEQLLCLDVPPPPPNVDTTVPPTSASLTQRQFLQQHSQNPGCSVCHASMDALGDAFEEFDAIGRYRTMDGTQPVDPSGQLTGTAHEDGPVADATDLARRLSAADEVRACVARQWFRLLFGRVEDDADQGTLENASAAFKGGGYRVPDLLVAYTATRNFRYRTAVRSQ